MIEEEAVKAALFHDVGKALQRLKNEKAYHGLEGAKFLKGLKNSFFSDSVLASIYDHHYRAKRGDDEIKFFEDLDADKEQLSEITKIVKKADSFDAGQRRETKENSEKSEEGGWSRVENTRVISFFSYAKEKQGGQKEEEINFEKLKTFPLQFFSGPSWGVSEPGYKYSEMNHYLDKAGFYNSLEWAVQNKSFDNAINNSLVWLREFSWFMPASTRDKENKSSIFEHSKNVAAFARALSESTKEKKPALLVLGDFSGIQGFIKNQSLKSEDQKGFTKRSRGRSFLIQILTELSIQLILRRTRLNRASVPISAGGHFYLLVPNTRENIEILEKTEREINELLIKYTDKLGLVVTWVEIGGVDFRPECLEGIIKDLNKKKNNKKFQRLLSEEMHEKVFSKEFGDRACKSCGFKGETISSDREETELQENDLCELCKLSQGIGEKYKAEKLYLVTSDHPLKGEKEERLFNDFPFRELGHVLLLEESGGEIKIPRLVKKGFFYCFVDYRFIAEKYKPENKFFSKELLEEIKERDVSFDFGFKPSTGTPELAKIAAVGEKKSPRAKLAHLKLDVDNLGETLKKAGTISQLSTISNQLLVFFGKKISEMLLENKEYSDLYTVFIGGDDIYFLGRYDKIFRFSKEITSKFDAFYAKDATLSGGLTLLHHAFPMNLAMELAEVEIGNAKAYEYNGKKKNAVSLFGKSVKWKDWFEILDFSERLNNSDVSTAQLYALMKLLKKEGSRIRKIHQVYYLFGRAKEREKNTEVIDELKKRVLNSSMNDWPDHISKKAILLTEVALLMKRIKIAKEGGEK